MINIIFDDSEIFYFARTRVLERLALAARFAQGRRLILPGRDALGQIFWYTVGRATTTDLAALRSPPGLV